MTNSKTINRVQFELDLIGKGVNVIAGVDEVGRGPLAGPMVTAAVAFNNEDLLAISQSREVNKLFGMIKDSKILSERHRNELGCFIRETAYAYNIETIDREIIDQKGISTATQIGFFNAVKKIPNYQHVLTDNFKISLILETKQTNIVKGDNLSISIGAASIIAKVFRDEIMVKYAEKYPQYGFEKHKGYGTKQHLEAIYKHGICEIHRKSFEPIKTILSTRA